MPDSSAAYTANLRLYGWIKMLTKRVYLPTLTVYLAQVGHVTVAQLGLLVTISAVCSLISDVPTGYLADKFTRRAALMTGALLLCLATLIYIGIPGFTGAVIAAIIESFGFSCISGAGEALMHDTLAAMGQTHNYIRVLGKAQSFGLVGNTLLVALAPLTYSIDPRLPFACGTLATLVFVGLVSRLHEPPHHTSAHANIGLVAAVRRFITRRSLWFFAVLGLLSALYSSFAPYQQLILTDLGLNPSLLGLAFAASSIVGAILGRYIYLADRLSLNAFSLVDTGVATGSLLLIGLTHNLWVAFTVLLLSLAFWRVRGIVYQHHLLSTFSGLHKATLISSMNLFENVSRFWVPAIMATSITAMGYYRGYTYVGAAAAIILVPLFILAVSRLSTIQPLRPHKPAPHPQGQNA